MTFVVTLVAAAMSAAPAAAGKPCSRRTFESTLVAGACKSGGQDEAKKVMKTYLKTARKQNSAVGCATCHSKLNGSCPLKPDGLKLFKQYGGK